MANTPNQFAIDFARVLNAAGDNAKAVVVAASLKLLQSIDVKSPVGNPSLWGNPGGAPAGYTGGQFRANWNYSIGAPDATVTLSTDASLPIAKAAEQSAKYKLGDKIYISNSMPYAYRLEYEGWSRQAPQGMVRLSVIEFKQSIKQEASAL